MVDLTRPIVGIENRTAQEVFDIMCDRIRLARTEASAAVKAKTLEWTKLSTGWIAHTAFHSYEVVKTDHGFMATYANSDFAWGEEYAMKSAAQVDFERRILSALSPAPQEAEAVRVYEPYPGAFDGILGADAAPQDADAAEGLDYGQKLIAEAISYYFGDRDDHAEDEFDTTISDVWDAFDRLTQPPAPAVTEAMVEAAWDVWQTGGHEYGDEAMRAAIEAALQAAQQVKP